MGWGGEVDSFIPLPQSASQIATPSRMRLGKTHHVISILCKANSAIASDWPHKWWDFQGGGGEYEDLKCTRMSLYLLQGSFSPGEVWSGQVCLLGGPTHWPKLPASCADAPEGSPSSTLQQHPQHTPHPPPVKEEGQQLLQLEPDFAAEHHTSLKSWAWGQVFSVLTDESLQTSHHFSLPWGVYSWTQTARGCPWRKCPCISKWDLKKKKAVGSDCTPTRKSARLCNKLLCESMWIQLTQWFGTAIKKSAPRVVKLPPLSWIHCFWGDSASKIPS